ncbi:hypothetical protein VNI00_006435 [Paramarasmius palmivorus]|uniref:Uncharacterized protein n=1 Tax=Paramarasmius palmivorus TaxID=297713 RepID=A0AAW0D9K0_9AGAR
MSASEPPTTTGKYQYRNAQEYDQAHSQAFTAWNAARKNANEIRATDRRLKEQLKKVNGKKKRTLEEEQAKKDLQHRKSELSEALKAADSEEKTRRKELQEVELNKPLPAEETRVPETTVVPRQPATRSQSNDYVDLDGSDSALTELSDNDEPIMPNKRKANKRLDNGVPKKAKGKDEEPTRPGTRRSTRVQQQKREVLTGANATLAPAKPTGKVPKSTHPASRKTSQQASAQESAGETSLAPNQALTPTEEPAQPKLNSEHVVDASKPPETPRTEDAAVLMKIVVGNNMIQVEGENIHDGDEASRGQGSGTTTSGNQEASKIPIQEAEDITNTQTQRTSLEQPNTHASEEMTSSLQTSLVSSQGKEHPATTRTQSAQLHTIHEGESAEEEHAVEKDTEGKTRPPELPNDSGDIISHERHADVDPMEEHVPELPIPGVQTALPDQQDTERPVESRCSQGQASFSEQYGSYAMSDLGGCERYGGDAGGTINSGLLPFGASSSAEFSNRHVSGTQIPSSGSVWWNGPMTDPTNTNTGPSQPSMEAMMSVDGGFNEHPRPQIPGTLGAHGSSHMAAGGTSYCGGYNQNGEQVAPKQPEDTLPDLNLWENHQGGSSGGSSSQAAAGSTSSEFILEPKLDSLAIFTRWCKREGMKDEEGKGKGKKNTKPKGGRNIALEEAFMDAHGDDDDDDDIATSGRVNSSDEEDQKYTRRENESLQAWNTRMGNALHRLIHTKFIPNANSPDDQHIPYALRTWARANAGNLVECGNICPELTLVLLTTREKMVRCITHHFNDKNSGKADDAERTPLWVQKLLQLVYGKESANIQVNELLNFDEMLERITDDKKRKKILMLREQEEEVHLKVHGVTGEPTKKVSRSHLVAGYLHCGCSAVHAIKGFYLWKTQQIYSPVLDIWEGWKQTKPPTRTREFLIRAFEQESHLDILEMFDYEMKNVLGHWQYVKVTEEDRLNRQAARIMQKLANFRIISTQNVDAEAEDGRTLVTATRKNTTGTLTLIQLFFLYPASTPVNNRGRILFKRLQTTASEMDQTPASAAAPLDANSAPTPVKNYIRLSLMVQLPADVWGKILTGVLREEGSRRNTRILLIRKGWNVLLYSTFYREIMFTRSKSLRSLNRTLILYPYLARYVRTVWICFGFQLSPWPTVCDGAFPPDYLKERDAWPPSRKTAMSEKDLLPLKTLLTRLAPFITRLSVSTYEPIPNLKETLLDQDYDRLHELILPVELFYPTSDEEADALNAIFPALRKLRLVYDVWCSMDAVTITHQDFTWLTSVTHLYLSYGSTATQTQIDESILSLAVPPAIQVVVLEVLDADGIPFELEGIVRCSVHPSVIFLIQEQYSELSTDLKAMFPVGDWRRDHVTDLLVWVEKPDVCYQSVWEIAEKKVEERWKNFRKSLSVDRQMFVEFYGFSITW